jgi:ribosome-binding protein aMBF1 (putative translation factor)
MKGVSNQMKTKIVLNRELMREKRENLLMSQEDVASKVKTKNTCVCQWETGASNPSFKSIKKIAKALKCKPEELIKRQEV